MRCAMQLVFIMVLAGISTVQSCTQMPTMADNNCNSKCGLDVRRFDAGTRDPPKVTFTSVTDSCKMMNQGAIGDHITAECLDNQGVQFDYINATTTDINTAKQELKLECTKYGWVYGSKPAVVPGTLELDCGPKSTTPSTAPSCLAACSLDVRRFDDGTREPPTITFTSVEEVCQRMNQAELNDQITATCLAGQAVQFDYINDATTDIDTSSQELVFSCTSTGWVSGTNPAVMAGSLELDCGPVA